MEIFTDYGKIIDCQRKFFESGATQSLKYRIDMLDKLYHALKKHETNLLDALKKDLGKASFEAYMAELGILYTELNHTKKHLKEWMKPKKVASSIIHFPAKSYTLKSPLGVTLIMSPWNYPLQLTIAPVISAIAAGNCVVIKPSRYSAYTIKAMIDMIEETFDRQYISIFDGGSEVNTALLDIKFDHIFFTGSERVGKIVMEKAAKFLCPVTLELGGKSPCIVEKDADIPLAAKRIMWGKCINSGQTCVAPDYLYAHEDIKDELIACMRKYLRNFFGEDVFKSDFGKIINDKHYARLKALLELGDILIGGKYDDDDMKIEPTVIENVKADSELETDEIFGPILPVYTYKDIGEVIKKINHDKKPLAFYFFSKNKKMCKDVVKNVAFGGATINDTIMHLTNMNMPFGGVGESGMGSYHGEKGFETFSHQKSIMERGRIDLEIRYAPYRDKIKQIKKFMK